MSRTAVLVLAALAVATAAFPQERRNRIDVEHYAIAAEINPADHSLTAEAKVRFVPLDEDIFSVSFELNNALNVSKVIDDSGREVQTSRNRDDFSVRLSFGQALVKGKAVTLTFLYGGVFAGREESPVYGICFAAIHSDYSYLLYPARWFPVSGYTTDRYAADLRITVPEGHRVVSSGLEKVEPLAGKSRYIFEIARDGFPGSVGVVSGEPARISFEGVTTLLYFRGPEQAMAGAYGQEIGKVMTHFTGVFGLPPQANLTVVETGEGAPNGYAAEGILFLSPRGIGEQVNSRLLANQITRQWFGHLVSPSSRNHLWIVNGMARYAELLYLEHLNGPGAMEKEVRDTYIEALTVDNPPLIQSARLEDYSPEYWALTGAKGAAVYNMLRTVVGDEKFFKILKEFPDRFAGKPASTDDLRKTAEDAAGTGLQYFFIQWIESGGAPEFKMDYTIFRTQKGFRVMGKVAQDLDTFRMPVDLQIETEGNPESKRIEVAGTSSEFVVETFGKPKNVTLDPNSKVLRLSDPVRVAVAIRRGEQFTEISEFGEALKEYQRALEVDRNNSLAHYRIGEVFFLQNNFQSAANQFREALNGDLEPKWVEVWSHINLGKIFDITGQRERALNEYRLAVRTKDNTQNAQELVAQYLKAPYERPARPD
jgi:hypothetical protein